MLPYKCLYYYQHHHNYYCLLQHCTVMFDNLQCSDREYDESLNKYNNITFSTHRFDTHAMKLTYDNKL